MNNVTKSTAELKIASANLQYGGRSGDDDSRWHKSMQALAVWDPDIVLLQEMTAPAAALQAHLWATANLLGMVPVLGPMMPYQVSGSHPAILVRTTGGITIADAGPPRWPAESGPNPAWCHVLLEIPGMLHPLSIYSVHLPARAAMEQLPQAQRLASLIARDGQLTIAGGDFNCLAPGEDFTQDRLEAMPARLRPARMRAACPAAGSIVLTPNYDVHNTLIAAGLTDAASQLSPDCRQPPELTSTGIAGNGRIDRYYVSEGIEDTLVRYEQQVTGGSDHLALLLTVDIAKLATITPSEPIP